MKKQRNICAYVLIIALLLSVFAVPATAVFSDESSIKTKDAVELLTTLSIIKGCPDGNFYPKKTITRGEFVKMLYVLKHGGNDDGAAYYKNAVKPFSDTKGHWAEGYINYASVSGIVHGTGNGKFQPNSTITGVEAAKILLTVAGYDVQKAGLTGTNWGIKTAALASEKGFFEDYRLALQNGCERQYAAQMMYNSIYSNTVKWNGSQYEDLNQTIGEKYLSFAQSEGVLVATGDYALGEVSGTAKNKMIIKSSDGKLVTFDYNKDLSKYIGQTVAVAQNSKRDKLYGVHGLSKNTLIETELCKVQLKDGNKITIDNKEYRFSANAVAYTGEQSVLFSSVFTQEAPNSGVKVTFISNDGDAVIDLAIIAQTRYGKITGVYKDRIATDISGFAFIVLNDSFKKAIVYDGAAKDDYITLSENLYDGSITITEMDSISGKVTALRQDGVQIDSNWYELSDNCESGTTLPGLEADVKLYLIGNYIYAKADNKPAYKDLAYVAAASKNEDLDGYYDVKLLFTDGNQKLVKSKYAIESEALVSYSINKGIYSLVKASESQLAGADGFENGNTGFTHVTDKLGNSYIDDNAIIFVQYKTGEGNTAYRVLKGSELNAVTRDFGIAFNALYVKKNGFQFIVGAAIKSETAIPGYLAEYSYGYLTESPGVTKIDDIYYAEYIFWDGKKEVTRLSEGKEAKGKPGDIIRFDLRSDGKMDAVSVMTNDIKAVSAYNKANGDFMVYGDTALYRITDKTAVFYVDSDSKTGYEKGAVMLADKLPDGQATGNIRFGAKTEKIDNAYFEVNFIIIDLNNEMQ